MSMKHFVFEKCYINEYIGSSIQWGPEIWVHILKNNLKYKGLYDKSCIIISFWVSVLKKGLKSKSSNLLCDIVHGAYCFFVTLLLMKIQAKHTWTVYM